VQRVAIAQKNAGENVVAPEAYGRSFGAAVQEPPRMHPDDLALLAKMVGELAQPSVRARRCTEDNDVIPPGATYATARQIARRFQVDLDEVYAAPEFFGAVERPGKHKRYCIAVADASWALHRVEQQMGRRPAARRTARRPQAPAGPPLVPFV
jgi:hypothetical protein